MASLKLYTLAHASFAADPAWSGAAKQRQAQAEHCSCMFCSCTLYYFTFRSKLCSCPPKIQALQSLSRKVVDDGLCFESAVPVNLQQAAKMHYCS